MMNDIIVLNNSAILCLQHGNFNDAFNIMIQASRIMFLVTQDTPSNARRKNRDCNIAWTRIRVDEREPTNDTKIDESPTIYPYAPTLIKPCCQNAFSTERICCTNCEDDSNVYPINLAPVVSFNLGLCCQLLGSDVGYHTREGSLYLNQATCLYEKVFRSCRSNWPSHGLSTMKMAVLNNQGGIFFQMGKQDACLNAMECMSDILASISQSFLCQKWGTFYLNLKLLHASSCPAAAA